MNKRKKREKIGNFFRENYSKSWGYIKESKKFIWGVVIIFVVSAIIGFFFQPPEIVNAILDYIKNILAKTEGMSSIRMIGFIFLIIFRVDLWVLFTGFFLGYSQSWQLLQMVMLWGMFLLLQSPLLE